MITAYSAAREKLADIDSEVLQLSHHTRRDGRQLWLGEKQDGLDTAKLAVDISLIALVFKVLDRAHTLDNECGAHLASKVYCKPVERLYLYARLVLKDLEDSLLAVAGRTHTGLVDIVANNTYHQLVEQRQRTFNNTGMTNSKGVESTHKNAYSHILVGKSTKNARNAQVLQPKKLLFGECF